MRAGQADRQLDLAEGRRGDVPASGEARAALRRGGRRDGVRREGTGRHARSARRRSRGAATICWSSAAASRPRTSSSTRTCSRSPPASRSTTNYAVDFIDATRWIKAHLPHAKVSGGISNVSVQLPRQRAGARGDPHGVPVPRDSRGPDDGHRQRRPARRLRRARSDVARSRRGRRAEPGAPTARSDRSWSRSPRTTRRQGGSPRRTSRGANEPVEVAAVACAREGHRATGSSRTPRRRGLPSRRAAGKPIEVIEGPADGRHERRRRPVRCGQDVPAAGREERARDEAGGRASHSVHRGGEGGVRRRREAEGPDRDGDGQGRRARHRQEHRRRRAPVQQLRRRRSRRHGAGAEDPRDGARAQRRRDRPVRPHHAVARGDGARRRRRWSARASRCRS